MKECKSRGNDQNGEKPTRSHETKDSPHELGSPANDDEILQFWISEHGAVVRRYLIRFVGAHDVAEDLFQDVFLRASIALDHYHEHGRARAFLLRIAQRLALAHFRDEKRQSTVSDSQWQACEPVDVKSPAQSIEQKELRSKLLAALGGLPLVQREVLCFRFFDQLDFRSIADILHCPRSTAFSHCRRGLARLRHKLKDAE